MTSLSILSGSIGRYARGIPWSARFSLAIIAIYMVIVAFAPLIAPYGEAQVVGNSWEPWSARHLLGTDVLGRDVVSRLLYAIRNTSILALSISFIAFISGTALGLFAAFKSEWADAILARLADALMSFPQLILALLVLSIYGNSIGALIGIIALLDGARIFRLARAVGMNIVAMPYIEAARLRNESLAWCIWREVLPNAAMPLLAEFGIRFCYVFMFISGLNFLGLGLQPPTADLGSMVRETSDLISFGDFTPLIPAAAIAILTIAVNFAIDGILKTHGEVDQW
jgi:peptide/nickel transport system permease protein